MSLQIGIVGLANVGKSTLFNALTNAGALAANYPFATIEPNTGIVGVPDERLAVLAKMYDSDKVVPATVEFVDIAGLIAGASKGEGLGNKFLAHNDEEYYHDVDKLFKENSITYAEIEKMLEVLKNALNTLIKDLIDTTWHFTKEGVDAFTYICKVLKEKKEMHIKRIKQ